MGQQNTERWQPWGSPIYACDSKDHKLTELLFDADNRLVCSECGKAWATDPEKGILCRDEPTESNVKQDGLPQR